MFVANGPPHLRTGAPSGAKDSDIWATTWADDGHLYTAYGDVFAIGCVIIALGFVLFVYREKRRKIDAD